MRRPLLILLAAACPLLAGCGYIDQAIVGQLDIIANSVPAEDAYARGIVDIGGEHKLVLIRDVLRFGRERIGLTPGESYTLVYDTAGNYPSYSVVAAYVDRVEPVMYDFPIVGKVPYRGFFDPAAAEAETAKLRALDLDVRTYRVAAYSTLGFFADPVYTSMLRTPPIDLVSLILHETTHSTIYRAGNSTFNENLAVFVEREGTRQYLAARGAAVGLNADDLADAERGWKTAEWFRDQTKQLRDELEAYYDEAREAELSLDAVREGRQAVFTAFRVRIALRKTERPDLDNRYDRYEKPGTQLDNAVVVGFATYEFEQALFEKTWAHANRDWPTAMQLWREASQQPDPLAHLRDVVGDE